MKPNISLTFREFTKRHGLMLLYGVFCIVIDQILKQVAQLFASRPVYIIPRTIGWEYFENPGIAFGLPIPQVIVIPLSILIISGAIFFLQKNQEGRRQTLGAILIIAGAVSNLIDRVMYGFTIDYIRIITSIFNLADVVIVIGIFLLLKTNKKRSPMQL